MKTKEQIELAEFLSNELQDYITLAKVQKKLNDKERINVAEDLIQNAKNNVIIQGKNL